MKAIRKHRAVEAVKWTGGNADEISSFVESDVCQLLSQRLFFNLGESSIFLDIGDWVLKHENGSFEMCDSDFFAAEYELEKEAAVHDRQEPQKQLTTGQVRH